jgi:hypothetical protein
LSEKIRSIQTDGGDADVEMASSPPPTRPYRTRGASRTVTTTTKPKRTTRTNKTVKQETEPILVLDFLDVVGGLSSTVFTGVSSVEHSDFLTTVFTGVSSIECSDFLTVTIQKV